MEKTRLKQLLLLGLGHITAGMFFGTGCIIVEHANNILWPEEDSTPAKIASDRTVTPDNTAALTSITSHQ